MRVLESFTEGKFGDPALNEDKIVITEDFIAVLDGVTAKSCPKIDGKSPGRFAVDSAGAAIQEFAADITARQAVDTLSVALKKSVAEKADLPHGIDHPAFGIVIYSRHRRQIWRVADPSFLLDGVPYLNEIPVDAVTSAARAFMIEAALIHGKTLDDIMRLDVGRDFITPMLREQHLFANRPGPYGYGDIDGRPVPNDFVQVFDASAAKEIVFASDGYPKVFTDLARSEKYLAEILRDDPLLFRRYKSTKGLQPGQVSFDDRAYVRFQPLSS